MRKLFIILGLITSIIAVVLAALPLFNIAFIPAIAALIFGCIAFYLSKQQNESKKIIQLIFLLTIIALSFATYKAVFSETEVGDTEKLEERVQQAEENAIEELEDLDLDIEELDGLETSE